MKIKKAIEIVTDHIRKRPLPIGDDPQVNRRIVEACETLELILRQPMLFVSILKLEEGNP